MGSICIISYHFDGATNGRPKLVRRVLRECYNGDVQVVCSDFDHFSKQRITQEEAGVVRCKVRAYRKNISLARLASYFDFAKTVCGISEVRRAALVYVCVPDYLAALALLWSRRSHPCVIVDVVDLWPEALPLPGCINVLVKCVSRFGIAPLRRVLFRRASVVLFQSKYFMRRFGASGPRCGVVHMASEATADVTRYGRHVGMSAEIRVLFLGSINSITDIESLIRLLRHISIRRRVVLMVVGGGTGMRIVKTQLAETCVELEEFGMTFDESLKNRVFRKAHFGYNGYKQSTEVAVSYKSIEYLQAGIPIINSAKADTRLLVDKFGCGFNFSTRSIVQVAEKMLALSDGDYDRMAKGARRAFEESYSYGKFRESLWSYVERFV